MIREAAEDDTVRIVEILVFSWRTFYRGIIPDEYLFKKLTVPNRLKDLAETMRKQKQETYVFDDPFVKGFITFGRCRDEDKNEDSFELMGLYTDPLYTRLGIGQQLINFCEVEAKKRKKKEISLWVLKKNRVGINFYEKNGFLPDGAQKELKSINALAVRYTKII